MKDNNKTLSNKGGKHEEKLCIALIIIALCGLLGCNKQSNNTGTINNNTKTKTEKSTNQEDNPEQETTNKLNITEGTGFHDNVAIVKTAEGKKYAINKTGKILFEVNTNSDILFFDGVASMGNNLIDKNGNILTSPEENGYTGLLSPYCNGYALAYYFEEGYPDSIIKIGVLNSNGKWEIPLSENHKIIKEMKKTEGALFSYIYNIPEVFQNITVTTQISDASNTIIQSTNVNSGNVIDKFINCYQNGIFAISLNLGSTNFYYDVKTDKILYKVKGTEPPYMKYLKDGIEKKEKEEELGTSFDIYGDGYYAKKMLNDAGTNFFCVYNEKGEEMFQPIQSPGNCICIDKEGFVIENESEKTFSYYDITGKQITTYENVQKMEPFYEGLSLVEYDDSIRYIDKSGNTVIE